MLKIKRYYFERKVAKAQSRKELKRSVFPTLRLSVQNTNYLPAHT